MPYVTTGIEAELRFADPGTSHPVAISCPWPRITDAWQLGLSAVASVAHLAVSADRRGPTPAWTATAGRAEHGVRGSA
jgi:hypothetical protein